MKLGKIDGKKYKNILTRKISCDIIIIVNKIIPWKNSNKIKNGLKQIE